MTLVPAIDTKKLKERLRRYERALEKEKATYGAYDDSGGKRYYVGPLYMLLGDLEGAIQSFGWFEREFPDDVGDLGQYACWALALHRAGKVEAAKRKLVQAMLLRPTVFAGLFGEPWADLSVDRTRDATDEEEVEHVTAEYMGMWSEAELAWAVGLYRSDEFARVRERYVQIERLLRLEPRGDARNKLVEEMFALKRM